MKAANIRQFCIYHWRMVSLYVLLALTLLITTTLKLHSLLPGFSASELQTYRAGDSLKTILHHPVNAPYLVLAWFVVKTHVAQSLLYFRAISAGLGFCTLAIFCALLYYWHGHRVALLGTLLLGTSSWFLHIARLGTPSVLVFGLLALIACGVWLQATKSPYAMLVLLILSASLVYVPGMLWLIGLSMAINWKRLDDIFSEQLAVVTIGTAAAIAMLAPLSWAVYRTPSVGKVILNLPAQGWPSILPTLRHIIAVPLHIFIYGQSNPIFSLGHLPVLNVFGVVMFGFGAYLYAQHIRLQRFKVLLAYLIGGSMIVGLGGMTDVGLLLPVLYLVVSAGIGYLFDQWFKVFPKNPLAQTIGVICMAILVLLVVTYNVRTYFISWPNATTTKTNFMVADIGSPKTFDTIHR